MKKKKKMVCLDWIEREKEMDREREIKHRRRRAWRRHYNASTFTWFSKWMLISVQMKITASVWTNIGFISTNRVSTNILNHRDDIILEALTNNNNHYQRCEEASLRLWSLNHGKAYFVALLVYFGILQSSTSGINLRWLICCRCFMKYVLNFELF